jgi:ADP-ribosylglycohydrolase
MSYDLYTTGEKMSIALTKKDTAITLDRASAALRSLYVGDALSMPAHWFYNPQDILQAFPGGIQKLEDAPSYHPSSIMSLHSTARGGRGTQSGGAGRSVVGEVILKGKTPFWGQANQHYHQGMKAGENTLNAHCARLITRSMIAAGRYDQDQFLDDYIRFMTADVPQHPDTYAESFHRGFFANLESGKPRDRCGAVTHDTPSVGGLVMMAPIAISARLNGIALADVQALCREHLFLTHPDANLVRICDAYIELIDALLFRKDGETPRNQLITAAQNSIGLSLSKLTAQARTDSDVLGGRYSTACYITDSWPGLLYLAYKYVDNLETALLANANLGGDNVHRGAVLGVILGLANSHTVDEFFTGLKDRQAIDMEISALLQ